MIVRLLARLQRATIFAIRTTHASLYVNGCACASVAITMIVAANAYRKTSVRQSAVLTSAWPVWRRCNYPEVTRGSIRFKVL